MDLSKLRHLIGEWMAHALRAIGPLRVPLLGAFVLLALPLAAVFTSVGAAGLLRGLFDLNPLTPNGSALAITLRTAVTSFFAWLAYGLAAVAIYQTGSMILDFSPDRLRYASPRARRSMDERLGLRRTFLLCLPALYASYDVSAENSAHYWAVILGGILALGAVVLTIWGGVVACAQFDHRDLRWIERLLLPILERIDTSGYLLRQSQPAIQPVPAGVDLPPRALVDPLHHHVWAVLFFFLSLVVWLLVALWARSPWIHDVIRVPALCSAMLLVMLLTWMLSGLTFFLDFYRVPILSLLIVLGGTIGLRDHTFAAGTLGTNPTALLPQEVVNARRLRSDSPIVVVASAGGGIQAAGWTARVLAGIAEAARSDDELNEFLGQVVAVSGVSGGSVGLAPFALVVNGPTTRQALNDAVRSALDSSLDPVAAAFATFDLLPLNLSDRGNALEASWERSWAHAHLSAELGLADLADRTNRGLTPAIMFNATDMTTGERLIIGTTVPRGVRDGFIHAARVEVTPQTHNVTIGYKPRPLSGSINIAVAARLSATFPFITPASRCANCPERDYVVDGGYIDNYGVESLVDWLEPLLAEVATREVLIVQIVSFPESENESPHQQAAPSQLAAPVEAFLNVRSPGQGRRAAHDIHMLQDRFPTRVKWIRFVYEGCRNGSGAVVPLSWHLSAAQKNDLDEWWNGCDATREAHWQGYKGTARDVLDWVLRSDGAQRKAALERTAEVTREAEVDTTTLRPLAAE